MVCPYCNGEMEKGLITSRYEIAWLNKEKRPMFGNAAFHKGSVVLSEYSFVTGGAVIAYLCRHCRKVIIDYADGKADYNAN